MSDNPHSPGPWRWQLGERWARLYSEPEGQKPTRVLRHDNANGDTVTPIAPADRRLIAAAPDLLEALVAIRGAPFHDCPWCTGDCAWSKADDMARAAIRKATRP